MSALNVIQGGVRNVSWDIFSQMIEFCGSGHFTGLGIFNSGRFGELGVW